MAERAHLRELRDSVTTAPALYPIIDEIYKTAQWVHIDFLFHPNWSQILYKILRMVTGTKDAWKRLAHYLGLSTEQIKYIQEWLRTKEDDPTYYTLVTYSYEPDATFGRFLKCLQQAELYTVVQETYNNIKIMIENELEENVNKTVIIRPKCKLVTAPEWLIYSEKNNIKNKSQKIEQTKIDRCKQKLAEIQEFDENNMKPAAYIENQVLVHREGHLKTTTEKTVTVKDPPKYFQIVLVTYADDGIEIVNKIIELFLNNYPKVGVLTLEKNSSKVYENNGIIFEWCRKVNYIIPVITKKYLEIVMDRSENKVDNHKCLDQKYAQVIYDWYRGNYINKSCLNRNIRCVIPDGFNRSPEWNEHLDNLCFQVWFPEKNLKTLYDRIVYNCDQLELHIPRELPEEEIISADSTINKISEVFNTRKKKKNKFLSFKIFTIPKRTKRS